MGTSDSRQHTATDTIAALRRRQPPSGQRHGQLSSAALDEVDSWRSGGIGGIRELAVRVMLRPGQRVLDLACGHGSLGCYLAADHGCRVVAQDVDAGHLAAARQLAPMVGVSSLIHFLQADFRRLPFTDSRFDVVWLDHLLPGIAHKAAWLDELRRVLKPGGRLAFHDLFHRDEADNCVLPWRDSGEGRHAITPGQWRQLLQSSGFDVVDWRDNYLPGLDWYRSHGPPPRNGDDSTAYRASILALLNARRLTLIFGTADKS